MTELEEKMAHLTRALEDLSDVVARQDREIDRLRAHVDLLIQREGARQSQGDGGVILGDERPPHY
jgi:SlyX protein